MFSDKKLLITGFFGPHFPVPISYVASTLERKGIAYDYRDLYGGLEPVHHELSRGGYWGIGLSGIMSDFWRIRDFLSLVKKDYPDIVTFLGGRITRDLSSDVIFRNLDLDFYLKGESEGNLVETLFSPEGNRELIPGLVPRHNKAVGTLPERRITDLRGLRPSYSFMDVKRAMASGHIMIPIMTGRGCPGSCTFCGPVGEFIPRPFEDIFWELNQQLDLGIKNFTFMSPVLFDDEEVIVRFAEEYRKNFGFPFSCSLRATVSADTLKSLRAAGCNGILVGFESFNDSKLRSIGKGTTREINLHFSREVRRLKIPFIECGLIFGTPGETREMMEDDLRVERHLGHSSRFYVLFPYPGTPVYKVGREKGLLPDEEEMVYSVSVLERNQSMFSRLNLERDGGGRVQPNLSRIPDDQFYNVVHKSYLSFLRKFKLKDLRVHQEAGVYFLKGYCPFCSAPLSLGLDHDNIGVYGPWIQNPVCQSSCAMVDFYFSATLYEDPLFDEHLEKIRSKITGQNVVLVGSLFNLKLVLELSLLDPCSFRLNGAYSCEGDSGFLFQDGKYKVPSTIYLSPQVLARGNALLVVMGKSSEQYSHLLKLGIPTERILRGVPL